MTEPAHKRYRIVAWGARYHPDLDYESDEMPHNLGQIYPFVNIQQIKMLPIDLLRGHS